MAAMFRVLQVIVRAGAGVLLLLVATYYLLASIPFSYYHFLQFPHFSWMPAFIRWHPLLMGAAVAALVLTQRDLPNGLKAWNRYVAIAGATMSICMAAIVWWPVLGTYEMAATIQFLPMLILGIVGAIDLIAQRDVVSAVRREHKIGSHLSTAVLAGLLTAAVYLLHAGLLDPLEGISLERREIVAAAVASLVGHVTIFVVAALGIVLPATAAIRWGWSRWRVYLSTLIGTTAVAAVFIRRLVLTSLILADGRALGIAVSTAFALVLFGAALVLRCRGPIADAVAPSAVSSPSKRISYSSLTLPIIAGALCVWVLPRVLMQADWGTTLQELVVCLVWTISSVLMRHWRTGSSRRGITATVCATAIACAGVTTAAARQPDADRTLESRPLDIPLAIERYATVDVSFHVVLDLLRPSVTDTQFFSDLQRLGDVTDDRTLRAVPLRMVEQPIARSTARPNIFIFVIDSLRPDYLSAYNPDVTFTPAIGAFARESIVMRQAFAPYTGTALSEPALWAGGLIPRHMYVQPFSTVNNLQRLAALDGYRQYISVDEILSVILGDVSTVVRLDGHLAHPERRDEMFKFDLCSTAAELMHRLDADHNQTAPVFFFSQPQSLHIRVLGGERSPQYDALHGVNQFVGSAAGRSRFFKPAVAALGRIDACFGEFISYLKSQKLYDNSIVILTSDHGDYYGEDGRWGHAFYVGPETVRIPLIFHAPQKLLDGRQWNPAAVAMLTDVTPTLYELLGHGPVSQHELLGEPFLLPVGAEPGDAPRDVYLMQSSYSRIFGLLDGKGDWLYTASANQVREEFFDLRGEQPKARTLSQADRLQYRKWLLERIRRVNAYYGPDQRTEPLPLSVGLGRQ